MQKRILLTGGRAPATLELSRFFARAGHLVFIAESVNFPITKFSNAVTRHFLVPKARFNPTGYARALEEIIRHEKIDFFIPTCEEVLYASHAQNIPSCHRWVDTFEKLDLLHNKWTFIEHARKLGFAVPTTKLLTSRKEALEMLRQAKSSLVLKPAYSRFASETTIWNPGNRLASHVTPTKDSPWVAQEYIDGLHLCTYSITLDGKVLAHSSYNLQERWGIGSSTVFENSLNEKADAWVQKFASATHFTGQIAFDFIETKRGVLYPIECNPRITSGVHLFSANDGLTDCFLGAQGDTVRPKSKSVRSVKFALVVRLMRLLLSFRSTSDLRKTLNFIAKSHDVVWDPKDPLPAFGQFLSVAEFLVESLRLGVSPSSVATHDIGYNGKSESL